MQRPKRNYRSIVARRIVILVALLSAAAFSAEDFFDTESSLPSRYGYLVIDTIVSRPTKNWRLNKEFAFESLPEGRQTIMIRLRAGSYHWKQVDVPYFDLPHQVDLTDDKRWSFTIERQKINYAGTLIVGDARSSDAVNVRYVNRSSEIARRLHELYPQHLATMAITFSGSYRDDYLDLVDDNAVVSTDE